MRNPITLALFVIGVIVIAVIIVIVLTRDQPMPPKNDVLDAEQLMKASEKNNDTSQYLPD